MLLQIGMALAITVQSTCDLTLSFTGPEPGESFVLATATGRRFTVPAPFNRLYIDSFATQLEAFEFVVENASRPNPMERAWGLLAPQERFLAVPWEYDAACRPVPWTDSDWVSAGMTTVFRLTTARRHEGRRVVDVAGSLWPYPYAGRLEDELGPNAPADVEEWLPARDFFHLMSRAPRADDTMTPQEQLVRFEDYYRGGPTYLLRRFPGRELLERFRRWASGADLE